MADNFQDNLCEAINIIVDKKIEDLKYDKVEEVYITDASQASKGSYIVKYLNSNLTVYSNSAVYSEGDLVQILIPNGDINNYINIIGLAKTVEETSITTKTSFLSIEDNIIFSQKKIGCTIASSDAASQKLIGSKIFFNHIDFDALYLECKIITFLNSYNLIDGNYGFYINIIYGDSEFQQLKFPSSKMSGNVLNLSSYTKQSILFDVSAYEDIHQVDVYFYQDAENFINESGEIIDIENAPENLFIKDLIVQPGFDTSTFTQGEDYIEITSSYNLGYKANEEKYISLTWFRWNENTSSFERVDLDNLNGYSISWYEYGYEDWIHEDGETYYYENKFNYILKTNINDAERCVKAVITDPNGEETESNILTFKRITADGTHINVVIDHEGDDFNIKYWINGKDNVALDEDGFKYKYKILKNNVETFSGNETVIEDNKITITDEYDSLDLILILIYNNTKYYYEEIFYSDTISTTNKVYKNNNGSQTTTSEALETVLNKNGVDKTSFLVGKADSTGAFTGVYLGNYNNKAGIYGWKNDEEVFSLDEEGDAKFKGTVYANAGEFTGEINANSGTIGGWNIKSNYLYGGNVVEGTSIPQLYLSAKDDDTIALRSGTGTGDNFSGVQIHKDGSFIANKSATLNFADATSGISGLFQVLKVTFEIPLKSFTDNYYYTTTKTVPTIDNYIPVGIIGGWLFKRGYTLNYHDTRAEFGTSSWQEKEAGKHGIIYSANGKKLFDTDERTIYYGTVEGETIYIYKNNNYNRYYQLTQLSSKASNGYYNYRTTRYWNWYEIGTSGAGGLREYTLTESRNKLCFRISKASDYTYNKGFKASFKILYLFKGVGIEPSTENIEEFIEDESVSDQNVDAGLSDEKETEDTETI